MCREGEVPAGVSSILCALALAAQLGQKQHRRLLVPGGHTPDGGPTSHFRVICRSS